METKRFVVSSKNGNGGTAGSIIIRRRNVIKEMKAVVFSCSEAKILNSYIDKMLIDV